MVQWLRLHTSTTEGVAGKFHKRPPSRPRRPAKENVRENLCDPGQGKNVLDMMIKKAQP